ncbi:hypothetical protein L7F22_008090 [Adiantum nelumboides]|nr:hypothetical protein [Adiantum nelumboides]
MGDAMKVDGAFIGQDASVTPLIGKLRLHIQGYVDKEDFFIFPLKHEDVILGAPWFDRVAASIKFPERRISFKFREKNMYIDAQESGNTLPLVHTHAFDKSIKSSISVYMIFVKDSLSDVNKTQVNESGSKEDLELSKFLNQFQDIFIDDIPGELPPKRGDDDHAIELIPGSSPPNKPPYRVSQAQQEEIMRQVNELVEKGMDDLELQVVALTKEMESIKEQQVLKMLESHQAKVAKIKLSMGKFKEWIEELENMLEKQTLGQEGVDVTGVLMTKGDVSIIKQQLNDYMQEHEAALLEEVDQLKKGRDFLLGQVQNFIAARVQKAVEKEGQIFAKHIEKSSRSSKPKVKQNPAARCKAFSTAASCCSYCFCPCCSCCPFSPLGCNTQAGSPPLGRQLPGRRPQPPNSASLQSQNAISGRSLRNLQSLQVPFEEKSSAASKVPSALNPIKALPKKAGPKKATVAKSPAKIVPRMLAASATLDLPPTAPTAKKAIIPKKIAPKKLRQHCPRRLHSSQPVKKMKRTEKYNTEGYDVIVGFGHRHFLQNNTGNVAREGEVIL